MSDLMTSITTPRVDGVRVGIADWGVLTRAEMIGQLRRYGDHLRSQVALLDATADGDLICWVVRGSAKQTLVRELKSALPLQTVGE